jgi:hypothetical protein
MSAEFGPFNLGTIEGRFLLITYLVILLSQAGYFLWTRAAERSADLALKEKRSKSSTSARDFER